MRPFIAQLSHDCRQLGWVANTPEGLTLAIEGAPELQDVFIARLKTEFPPHAKILALHISEQPTARYQNFEIRDSVVSGRLSPYALPDIATCSHCLHDLFNPNCRFYRYPFVSCSFCGPRYSIMHGRPYDRQRTTMTDFNLCENCKIDYDDITNRRFHAQTIACPNCGPQLILTDNTGTVLAEQNSAVLAAAHYLRTGKIIAVKGIGGFQIWADATNANTVQRLRIGKRRHQKPFAVMVADLSEAKQLCDIPDLEYETLQSPAAPIALLTKRKGASVADNVSPDTGLLGILLPYAPVHHLLLFEFGAPVVATSGNRHTEPICIDNNQALANLSSICDYFLMHNRPILRPLDDSVVRPINGKITILRRARGYVPTPVTISSSIADSMALGGHLKNTIAISRGRHLILSSHLGDLDCEASQKLLEQTISDLQGFYHCHPQTIIRDLHGDYVSSRIAEQNAKIRQPAIPAIKIQHHHAHILACMAEHDLEPPLLGVAWDGNGLGSDNNLWGGEFLSIHSKSFTRFGHLRPFSLPGGSRAICEPRRSALGLLKELSNRCSFDTRHWEFEPAELTLLCSALSNGVNCPRTTSAGRLFDAVASLLGVCQINQYEGQAAIILENLAATTNTSDYYPFKLLDGKPLTVDWQPMIEPLLKDIQTVNLAARKFHNTLSKIIAAVAQKAGLEVIALSGGCFQNALLTESTVKELTLRGFKVYCPQSIPPNDGGLALGQLYATKYISS